MGGCHSRSGQYSSGLPDPATVHRKDIEPTGATSGSFRQRPAQLRRVHTDPLFDVVALSAPGAFAVAADDGGITVYNWLNTSDVVSWRAHERSVNRLAWSASASMLASCSRDTSVKLWSVGVDVPLHTLAGHTLTVSAVDFSPGRSKVCCQGFARN